MIRLQDQKSPKCKRFEEVGENVPGSLLVDHMHISVWPDYKIQNIFISSVPVTVYVTFCFRTCT